METNNTFQSFPCLFKKLIMLEIDFVKLTIAEKLVILLSAFMLSFIALIIAVCAMLFISIGVVKMLSMVVSDCCTKQAGSSDVRCVTNLSL